MSLTKTDRRLIKRTRQLTESGISQLDEFGKSHYEIGLFNCLEHICPHSEYNTGRPFDDSVCSVSCRHINKCNQIVGLLETIKPTGMLISNPA